MGVVADVLLILWACKSKKSSFALCNEKLFFFFLRHQILVYCHFPVPLFSFASRSEGHLCLPVRYTHSFPEALQKLYRGEFRYDLLIFVLFCLCVLQYIVWIMLNNV